MLYAIDRFRGAYSVSVVGVGIAVKRLELPSLFPGQGVAWAGGQLMRDCSPQKTAEKIRLFFVGCFLSTQKNR